MWQVRCVQNNVVSSGNEVFNFLQLIRFVLLDIELKCANWLWTATVFREKQMQMLENVNKRGIDGVD